MPETKQAKKRRISPLLIRIGVINLVSLLILSLFNYFTFYNRGNKAFMQSLTQYNQRVADIAFKNIDKQIIRSAVELQYRFFSDISSNQTLLLPQERDISDESESIFALRAKLTEILALYPVVHSINIYYEATSIIVTGRGNVHFPQNADERDVFLPWYEAYAKSEKGFAITSLQQQVYPVQIYKATDLAQGNNKLISVVSTVKNSRWADKSIVVAVHVLPTYFAEYIDEEQGQFIIADADKKVVYVTPGHEAEAEHIIAAAADMKNDTVKLEALRLVVSHSRNDALGLDYYHAIPDSVFFKDYNTYLKDLLVIYLLSVAVMFAILTLISHDTNKAYRKRLLSSTKKVGLQLSEDESFDGSLDNLASQLTNINTEMQLSRPMLYYNHVRSLILGRQAGVAYQELNQLLGNFEGVLCVIVNTQTSDTAKLDLVAVQAGLQTDEAACRILLTTLEQNQICIVICTDSVNANAVREHIFERVSILFEDSYTADGQFMVFGEKREQCFKQAFDSVQTIDRYHFIFPQKQRLHYAEIGPVQIKNTGSHLRLFAEIEKDINGENLLAFKEHLYDLTESFKYGNYSIDYCSSTLRDCVTMLYNITQSRQLDMLLTFGYDIRAHYKQIADIDEFYSWSCELGEVLMHNLRQRKKALAPDLQSRILQLIDENIEKDLSLEFLADSLGLRPDILSRTFKQLLGKSYVDYVKEKKLGIAKQLIAQDMSIKDIAARLGYSSPQYFIKIFKESYGVTPYQYKKGTLAK